MATNRIPVYQRTLDGKFFRINENCYLWVNGHAEWISKEEFIKLTRDMELETLDYGINDMGVKA